MLVIQQRHTQQSKYDLSGLPVLCAEASNPGDGFATMQENGSNKSQL